MEWFVENWYVVVLGLVAALFIFGYRPKKNSAQTETTHEAHADDKAHKSGHSCCH